jgi:hypothetical protein
MDPPKDQGEEDLMSLAPPGKYIFNQFSRITLLEQELVNSRQQNSFPFGKTDVFLHIMLFEQFL